MDLTYPSEISPSSLSLRMFLPQGWEPRPHATAQAFAVDTGSAKGFVVNVLVLETRVLSDLTLDALVEETQTSSTSERMGVQLQGQLHDTISGHDAVLSALTFDDSGLPFPLFQAQAALLVDRVPGVRDLVHAYATCPAALAEQYATAFRAMFASLTLG